MLGVECLPGVGCNKTLTFFSCGFAVALEDVKVAAAAPALARALEDAPQFKAERYLAFPQCPNGGGRSRPPKP